jgi:hypothetical protein
MTTPDNERVHPTEPAEGGVEEGEEAVERVRREQEAKPDDEG